VTSGYAIRAAREDDLSTITAIYREEVLHGTATFELAPPDRAEMARRRAALAAGGFPFLIAEGEGGRCLGYAYAAPYRPRPAYDLAVEDSVYVAAEARRRGVGRALLAALVAAATAAGFRQMIAVIGDSANTGSIALHGALGFRMVGTLMAVGRKHGRWVDTVLMQRELGAGDATPPAREPG
jgi:phosphinothricin acetyltransferase